MWCLPFPACPECLPPIFEISGIGWNPIFPGGRTSTNLATALSPERRGSFIRGVSSSICFCLGLHCFCRIRGLWLRSSPSASGFRGGTNFFAFTLPFCAWTPRTSRPPCFRGCRRFRRSWSKLRSDPPRPSGVFCWSSGSPDRTESWRRSRSRGRRRWQSLVTFNFVIII